MTTTELEQVIRGYIRDIYDMEYIGKMRIEPLKPNGYKVSFGMSYPEKPFILCALLDDEEFLKFIKKELKTCLFHLKYYGEINLRHPIHCGPRDTSCGSCVKRN